MSKCIEEVTHKKVKVEENKRKAIFSNPSQLPYKKGKIDDCLVTEGVRADYFVSGEGKSVLIELKGSNVNHACEQLFIAAEHKNVKPHLEKTLGFLIICSRYPSNNTAVQLAASLAMKKYKARFRVYTDQREVNMGIF